MLERLINLIIRLKDVFRRIEEREQQAHGNDSEIGVLNTKIARLEKEQTDALVLLDELEEAIKKWD